MQSPIRVAALPVLVTMLLAACATPSVGEEDGSIVSTVINTDAGERSLLQEVLVEAPVADVWNAYTTSEGWMGWAAPLAEVDLRVGGLIRTHYQPGAAIGDAGTNTLHILSYVPQQLLILQAELEDRWPDVMKEDAEHLMNVIIFEELGKERTRIRSYGVGYRDSPAYDELLGFFAPANEGLFRKLKAMVE